jgi:hypothetical protein
MNGDLSPDQLAEMIKVWKDTVSKWSKLLALIEGKRISHAIMLRKVVEELVYFHHPDILRMMNEDQTLTPGFRALLIVTMRDTIRSCKEGLAIIENIENNPSKE